VAICTGVMEVREKRLCFVHEMRNTETDEVCAIAPLVAVHMETVTRRSCALPQAVAERAHQHVDDYKLPW